MTEQELREYNRKARERRVDEGYTYGQEAVEWGNDPNNMTDLGLKLHNLFNKSNRTNAHENIDGSGNEYNKKEEEALQLQQQLTQSSKMDFLKNPILQLLASISGAPGGWAMDMIHKKVNAHENIDTLIQADDNKDYFELLNNIMRFTPMGVGQNIGDISREFGGQRGSIVDQLSALVGGGEQDPMTPPRATEPQVPFSEYSRDRNQYMPWLDERRREKVRSIAEEHANKLTQPK
jgi:hypothetical protein